MKSDKDYIVLEKNGIMTPEAMSAYLQGRLSDSERAVVERMIAEDPFLNEAMEGLANATAPDTLTEVSAQINRQIIEQSGVPIKRSFSLGNWRYYAAAASLLLLIGIGWILKDVLLTDKQIGIAQRVEELPLTEPEAIIDEEADFNQQDAAIEVETETVVATGFSEAPAVEQEQTVLTRHDPSTALTKKDEQNELKAVTTKPQAASLPPPASSSTNAVAKQEDARSLTGAGLSRSQEGAKTEEVSYTQPLLDVAVPAQAQVSEESERLRKKAKNEATVEDAMGLFNSGRYTEAAEQFQQVLKKESDNPDALYFGGVADYLSGKTNRSLDNFNKLLKKGQKYRDGSKWYKAQILLSKNKKNEAVQLLNEIVKTDNPYSSRAAKKLEEIQR